MLRITSRQNAIVSRYRQVARGDDRTAIFIEGPHLLSDAIAARVPLQHVLVSSDVLARDDIRALVTAAKHDGTEVAEASRPVLDAISPVRSPTGVVAIGNRPAWPVERLFVPAPALILVAHGVQDPGNLGAIARAAEAAGASGLVTTGIGADPYGWK